VKGEKTMKRLCLGAHGCLSQGAGNAGEGREDDEAPGHWLCDVWCGRLATRVKGEKTMRVALPVFENRARTAGNAGEGREDDTSSRRVILIVS
jgi:hypothetical protein